MEKKTITQKSNESATVNGVQCFIFEENEKYILVSSIIINNNNKRKQRTIIFGSTWEPEGPKKQRPARVEVNPNGRATERNLDRIMSDFDVFVGTPERYRSFDQRRKRRLNQQWTGDPNDVHKNPDEETVTVWDYIKQDVRSSKSKTKNRRT